MFCAKAPRALQSKENWSVSPCWGKISCLTKKEALNCGFQDSVLLCVWHHKEQKRKHQGICCFPTRSQDDKCRGKLTTCPQRLIAEYEKLFNRGKMQSFKICKAHLLKADSDSRVTENINYISPRKVSQSVCTVQLISFFCMRAKVQNIFYVPVIASTFTQQKRRHQCLNLYKVFLLVLVSNLNSRNYFKNTGKAHKYLAHYCTH